MTKVHAMVIIQDANGNGIHRMDVIEFEGKTWLVPEWLDMPSAQVTMPARIVLVDTLPHERAPGSDQIVLTAPVPINVLEGRASPEQEARYVVVERPNIRLPIPGATH